MKVVAVNIVNFQFSEAFDIAIEAKVRAEQEALTEENKLEQIKFQAQQRVETARGEAESILLRANAEAEANGIIASSLTEQLVKYEGIHLITFLKFNSSQESSITAAQLTKLSHLATENFFQY